MLLLRCSTSFLAWAHPTHRASPGTLPVEGREGARLATLIFSDKRRLALILG